MLTVPTVQQGLTFAAAIVECTVLIFVMMGILTIAFPANPPVVQAAPPTETTALAALIPSSALAVRSEIAPLVAEVHTAPGIQVTRRLSNCEQLRQRCTSQGIRWRNAHGKGKHLTTQQMQDCLAQT